MTAPAVTTTYDDEQKKKLEEQLAASAQQTDATQQPPVTPSADTTMGTTTATPAGTTPAAPAAAPTMAVPSGAVAAPPPPPPPTPDFNDLTAQLTDFTSQWLSTPNQYGSQAITAARSAGEARLKKAEQEGVQANTEWAASRGLTGSNLESEQNNRLWEAIQRTRGEQEASFLDQLANWEQSGKSAAASSAMGLVGLGEQAREFNVAQGTTQQGLELEAMKIQLDAALQGRSLDIQQATAQAQNKIAEGQLGISQQQVDLEAQKLVQQAATEGRTLDLQEARDQASVSLQLKALGIDQQQVDLRAQEIQNQAQQAGRSMDIEEAKNQASQELAWAQIKQQSEQFSAQLAQRESEFARSYNLDEAKFKESQDQFTKQYSEQVASRLQDDEHFKATLQNTEAQQAIDNGLRSRALDLQQQGLDADTAFKQASLEQEGELRSRALDLQQQGMAADDAYRYAVLEEDAGFKARTLDLQEKGLSMDDAYRYAELAFRQEQLATQKDQFAQEMELRISQAKSDQERFDAMMELWDKYFGSGGTGSTELRGPTGEPGTTDYGDVTVVR